MNSGDRNLARGNAADTWTPTGDRARRRPESGHPASQGAPQSDRLLRGIPAAVLAIGSERWLKAEAIRSLKRRCLAPGFEEADFTRFQEPPEGFQEILEAVRTAPFGSPCRLVVVEGLGAIDRQWIGWLSGYLKDPNPKACLLICAERTGNSMELVLKGVRGRAEGVRGRAEIRWCTPLKGVRLQDWIVAQAARWGKRMTPEALRLLVIRVGTDLDRLFQALESLSLLVGDRPRITEKEVRLLVSPSAKETAFDILDRAAAGHLQEALEAFHQALRAGHLTVEQFMGALGWYYRMIWRDRRWPLEKVTPALEEVLKADTALKLGDPSPELLADRLLMKLAGIL